MKSLLCILLVLIVSGCTSVFFQPSRQVFPASFEKNITPRPFRIPSFDQTPLSAWYFSAPKQPAKALVVQFHGNAENMTTHYQSVYWLTAEGFDLITFDYRGYGSSPGDPSMTDVLKDVGLVYPVAGSTGANESWNSSKAQPIWGRGSKWSTRKIASNLAPSAFE